MEEITTPHFWSVLNYNFLPAILTQEVNYTEIILLHILEAGACFIKSISPTFSLGHVSRCGQKRIVLSSSLSQLSLPRFLCSSLSSLVFSCSCTHTCFFALISLALFPCCLFLPPFSLPFPFPFPTLPCLNFPRWNFCCIVWKLDANNEFEANSRSIRAYENNCIELCINAQSLKLRKFHCSCKNLVLYI